MLLSREIALFSAHNLAYPHFWAMKLYAAIDAFQAISLG